ncbi:hypothetical protein F4810DRAFT_648319 [Camillea tinctor]|nr:hypothetical protein F4810DRAFT_648319 [Camillea tinctor]
MLSQRIVRASALRSASRRLPLVQHRTFLPRYAEKELIDQKYPDYPDLTEAEDPGMNGGYINPARIKRQFRDPHADWWDKQERRNFGEPIHEDNDVLGMFTPYTYTWATPGKAWAQVASFIVTFLGVCWVVSTLYPDKPSYPREFEDGLVRELGGAGATRARVSGDPHPAPFDQEEED